MPNFSSIPAPRSLRPGRRLSARDLNQQRRVLYGARGGDPNTIVEVRPGGLRIKSSPARRPYQIIGVAGRRATVSGSFSGATPYIWFNFAANTAEWKSVTSDSWPPDTEIRDGRLGGPVEWWIAR